MSYTEAYDMDGIEIGVGDEVISVEDNKKYEVIEIDRNHIRIRRLTATFWVFSNWVRVCRDPIKFLERIPI